MGKLPAGSMRFSPVALLDHVRSGGQLEQRLAHRRLADSDFWILVGHLYIVLVDDVGLNLLRLVKMLP